MLEKLPESLRSFTELHEQYSERVLSSNGGFKKAELFEWDSRFPTSPEVEFFYKNYAPSNRPIVCIGLGAGIGFIEASMLFNRHKGYRWAVNFKTQELTENTDSWPEGGLLLATSDGDPFVAHTLEVGTPISAAVIGGGEFERITDSMAQFFEVLSIFYQVQYQEFNNEITNKRTCNPHPKFMNAIKKQLTPILSKENLDNLYRFFFE